jgi:metallo-beta-lactamase family protein
MLLLRRLKQRGDIPDVPVFLDSPMAARATAIYRKHGALLRLNSDECEAMCNAATFVGSPTASRKVSNLNYPSVIIAGSGMATGGRILHHLKTYAPDPRSHIVFPGFQVSGTRGAKMVAGDLAIKIHGAYIPVNAQVSHIESLSGHADVDELLAWLRGFKRPPKQTFVVHGERDAADALRLRISDELGWNVATVEHMQVASC